MTTTGWVVLGISNIPVYFFLGWALFKDWNDFKEALLFWFTPDIISAFRGEYFDDMWGEMKLGFWITCCIATVYGESLLLTRLMQ